MALSQITFQFDDSPEKSKDDKTMDEKIMLLSKEQPKQKRGRKSLKEISAETALVEIPEDEILFQKQYYSIGDVASMFKENTSLIRYWENEFDILKPRKNKKGDRYFRPEDVKNLKMIYHLLRERKYTIEGAKEFLKNNKAAGEKHQMIESLQKIKLFLLELKNNL
ncbi:MAG: MerR family transcriptional regulator [Ginsengibacter sp.]